MCKVDYEGDLTMVQFLAKIWIKDSENVSEPRVRQSYGILCGALGIVWNVLLFLGKFVAGTISKSVSITADAFNNLSDAGSSVVTLVGFKMAGAKPDPDHPFGHGRIEYLSGLVISGAILLMAVELLKSSIGKILHPKSVEFSPLVLGILAASILVKIYMCVYNRAIGKKVDSATMRATAMDSLSDACATFVVLIATIIGHFTELKIDGYCGVLVSGFIFYAGFGAARETLNPLLGQPPEKDFVEQIKNLVMSHEGVIGIHDLLVHDYGPGRQMISLHAEVPAEGDILEMHDMIDNIERELRETLKCDAVIHMDPVVTTDERVAALRETVMKIVKELNDTFSMHDFRVVMGPTHTNLIFDIVVPFDYSLEDEQIRQKISEDVKRELGEEYFCVINVDKEYI